MQQNIPDNKDNNLSTNEQTDDYNQKHEQCNKILDLMKKPKNYFQNYKVFCEYIKCNSKNTENRYYLISKEWLHKFVNFCKSNEEPTEYGCPSEIDNKILAVKDNSYIKVENDPNIFLNNRINLEEDICVISNEVWIKLKKIFGGGPEYEIIYHENESIGIINNIITKGVRINLLFIKNNVKNIKENDEIKDFMHLERIYLDIMENVIFLKKYINNILQKYKNKFFSDVHQNIQENIHYRLWLYSTYFGTPKIISEFIKKQIITPKEPNKLFNENNFINWKNFGKIFNSDYQFQIILLSFFDNNLIRDIFPNRYTQYFDYKGEFGNLKNEEENSIPYFTIIIEEAPFSFMTEDVLYRLGTCEKCKYKQITYNACECKNCFFCLKSCENIYKEKRNTHYIKCKEHIISIFNNENKYFYHNINNELKFSEIGLVNLGNTCYMNSALQCLRSIKELTNYFLNYFDDNQLNKKNLMGTGGFLALAYANYIFKMNHNDKEVLELKNFKNAIGIVDDRFAGYDQQDTHEFLSFLIDSIHEDLNRVINKPILNRKSSDWEKNYNSSLLDKLKSKIEWNNFLKRNQSIMVDLFYGQYKSSIICPKCEHNSTNFSIFLSLQLPIPVSKSFFVVKVFLYEEWFNTYPYTIFEIILSKNNSKVIVAKKIIGKIFGISPYQIEIFKTVKYEINKVYDDEEELNENINSLKAVKINLKTIQDIDNSYEQNKINYNDLERKTEKKIDEYVSYIRNLNSNNNNSEDECDIIIDINDDNVETIKINYEEYSLQKFIIKHYLYNSDNTTISNSVINKDYLIYTKTEQSCYDLYFQIFLAYFSILKEKKLGLNLNESNDFDELNKHLEELKILFNTLFKKYLEDENQFYDSIFDKYEELPFYLKLKVYKSKTSKFIPNSKKRKFKKFLTTQIEKENKNNEMKNKSVENIKQEEEKKEEPFVSIEINKNFQNKIDDKPKKKEIELVDGYIQYYLNQVPFINLGKEKSTNSKNDLKSKEKEKEKDNKNNNSNNNIVHSIIIVFNRRYLFQDTNGEYRLTNYSFKKIDLCPLFRIAHQNIEKISINDCFEEFTKLQTLDENNLYRCPKCKENIAANNKMELYKIPKILIIQLKRFENGQKIKTFIDFPIKNLDITQYISQSSPHFSSPSMKYDLFAVSNHYGELEYGHYDANCLNFINNNWYNFNDKKVGKIYNDDPEKIVTKDAYVLFYRQRKMEVINWDNIFTKQFKDIKDDNYLENIKEIKNDINNNNKKEFFIKSSIIELDEEEDEKELEEESLIDKDITLDEFVYNPFRTTYLKLKRRRLKRK